MCTAYGGAPFNLIFIDRIWSNQSIESMKMLYAGVKKEIIIL
jgi:hypothetical protein